MAKKPAETARRAEPHRVRDPMPARLPYRAEAWFWFVAGDETQVFSSARREFVPLDDAAYQAHLTAGGRTSRIASLDELKDVLAKYGLIVDRSGQYRQQRALDIVKALSRSGPDKASFQEAVGDQLDVIIAQVEAMRAELGLKATAEFADLVATIAGVKAATPKPGRGE